MLRERTIKNIVKFTGITAHSGIESNVILRPGAVNSKIVIIRNDLSGKPKIRVLPQNIVESMMCSSLAENGIKVSVIEHLMSALAGLRIDNLIIEIDGDELPIMDGSAYPFISLIQSGGIVELDAYKKFIRIKKRVEVTIDDRKVVIEPYDGLVVEIEITNDHPFFKDRNRNWDKFVFSTESYIEEISKARTFGFLKDAERLWQNGFALGSNFENTIVLDDNGVMNSGGLRHPKELVRHKILDAMGDMYIVGPLLGKFYGYNPGHALNNTLMKKLLTINNAFEYATFEDEHLF